MEGEIKVKKKCPVCKGKGEYYLRLPDDVGSPNLIKCKNCRGTGHLDVVHYGLPPDASQRRM